MLFQMVEQKKRIGIRCAFLVLFVEFLAYLK